MPLTFVNENTGARMNPYRYDERKNYALVTTNVSCAENDKMYMIRLMDELGEDALVFSGDTIRSVEHMISGMKMENLGYVLMSPYMKVVSCLFVIKEVKRLWNIDVDINVFDYKYVLIDVTAKSVQIFPHDKFSRNNV